MISDDKQQFGDFQTPVWFIEKVIQLLKNKYILNPAVVIEPTMGEGNFITESISSFSNIKNVIGIEINENYIENFKHKNNNLMNFVKLYNSNIFDFDFGIIMNEINSCDQVLLIGNPPWVTNSELTVLKSFNSPLKTNFKKNKGIEAITGKSNFDIAEYILLYLMSEFRNVHGTYFAFLCKSIVAKNIIRDLNKYNFCLDVFDVYNFDAGEVFDVSTDAVLLVTRIGNANIDFATEYSIETPEIALNKFGWIKGKFISNFEQYDKYSFIDGNCPFKWRQGLKHDLSKVMEFKREEDILINGLNQKTSMINSPFIFPLLKSSMLKNPIITDNFRYVLVTQKKVGDSTSNIEIDDPLVWKYLISFTDEFQKRKSIIYSKAPRFAMFGLGDYSFSKYKIAISGFYKEPIFSLTYSTKPVMLDDTCYFIGFNNLNQALVILSLLNNEITKNFLKSISFLNSKRPYTKDVLQRIDLQKLYDNIPKEDIVKYINQLEFSGEFNLKDVSNIWKEITSELI